MYCNLQSDCNSAPINNKSTCKIKYHQITVNATRFAIFAHFKYAQLNITKQHGCAHFTYDSRIVIIFIWTPIQICSWIAIVICCWTAIVICSRTACVIFSQPAICNLQLDCNCNFILEA
jgi:hypothetical protein